MPFSSTSSLVVVPLRALLSSFRGRVQLRSINTTTLNLSSSSTIEDLKSGTGSWKNKRENRKNRAKKSTKYDNRSTKKTGSFEKAVDIFINGADTPSGETPTKSTPTTAIRPTRQKRTKPPSPSPSPSPSSTTATDFRVFCSCLPGLEPYLYSELLSLGIQPTSAPPNPNTIVSVVNTKHTRRRDRPLRGGVSFTTRSLDRLLSCHLHLGTASHVFLRATPEPFRALGMEELYRKVSRLPFWKEYIYTGNGATPPNLDVRVTSSKSRLFHTVGIAERVERGIWDALGIDGTKLMDTRTDGTADSSDSDGEEEEAEDKDKIKILVRVHYNQVELSVDTSTTPLHRRGYRIDTGKAPLREDLAYSLLYSAGWGQNRTVQNHTTTNTTNHTKTTDKIVSTATATATGPRLLDPFCGSGTILIEGAAMHYGLPPGRLRPPPMAGSRPTMDTPHAWPDMVDEAMERARSAIRTAPVLAEDTIGDAHSDGEGLLASVLGSDRDAGVIAAAVQNAERAGVSDLVRFERCAISSNRWLVEPYPKLAPDEFVLVATNPPYGRRIASTTLAKTAANKKHSSALLPLYQTLGCQVNKMAAFYNDDEGRGSDDDGDDVSSEGSETNMKGARLAIIAQDPKLARRSGVKDLSVRFTTKHGGLNVCALTTTMAMASHDSKTHQTS